MKHAAYFLAAVPEPVRCLGVKLKPLSLGHYLLLSRFDSAFVKHELPTFSDLVLGLAICSRDYADAIRFLDSRKCRWVLQWWGWRAWLAVKCGHNLAASMLQFKRYFDAANKFPVFEIDDEDAGEAVSAPLVLIVKLALMKSGHTETEAMNKPWCAAIWEFASDRALTGKLKLVDDDELKELRELQAKANSLDMTKLMAAHDRARREAGLN